MWGKMLKKLLLGLVIFIVFIILLVWWIRTDEDLSPEAKELLGENYKINPNLVDHPYFYYLGIDAKDNVDPIQLGRMRYYMGWSNHVNDHESKSLAALDKQSRGASLSEEQVEQINHLKKLWDDEGVEAFSKYIAEHRVEMQKLVADNQMGLKRLNHLLNLDQYELLTASPDTESNIKYVFHLMWIDLVNTELNQDKKIQSYLETYKEWNTFNQKPISLIEKVVSNLHLERLIDLIRNEQLKKQNSDLVQLEVFKQDQLTLKSGIRDTMVISHFVNLNLVYDMKAYTTWLYLPIKTTNQMAEDLYPYKTLSELPYDQLKKNLGHVKLKKRYKYALKNSVGNILAQVARVDLEQYLVDNHIANNKVIVFNTLNQGISDVDTLNKNKQGYEFYKTKTELCIKNPHPNAKFLENPRSQRDSCVRMVL